MITIDQDKYISPPNEKSILTYVFFVVFLVKVGTLTLNDNVNVFYSLFYFLLFYSHLILVHLIFWGLFVQL